nr:unnamed protein product [Callosobruchus analis]
MEFLCGDYWTRPLTLSELMEEVENTNLDTDLIPNEVIIFSPDDFEVTDEDSGEEDNVVTNNLPGVQLRTLAEVLLPNTDNIFFDNLFTSLLLLLELKSRGLKGTGTIRANRLLKTCPIKTADKIRKEQRGGVNNELTVCMTTILLLFPQTI